MRTGVCQSCPVSPVDGPIEAVKAVNDAFYAAHEARDLQAMSEVWHHGEDVACIHPGWPILRGWPAVEASWKGIFAGPGRTQFIITNASVGVGSDLAWVTLEENLVDRGATQTVAATNLFRRIDGTWRMVAHHGSPVIARQA